MSSEILKKSYRFLLEDPALLESNFRILWHAGEPLALAMAFYESAFTLWQELAPKQVKAAHWIQTNATLINQDWCDLLRRWNVNVGVSIDGPQWMHDANRVDKTGKGTFDRVMRGIDLLRKNQIGFDIIAVLSNQALDYPEELWRFFSNLGAQGLAFNSDEIQGVNQSSSMTTGNAEARFESFFRRILELREQQRSGLAIRELDYFIEGVEQWQNVRLRSQEALPVAIINIGWNGDVSSLSPFLLGMKNPRYADFVFGNVTTSSIRDMLNDPRFQVVFQEVEQGIRKCQANCEYFGVCGGGTPATKYFEHGTFDRQETLACRLRIQAIGRAAVDFLEQQRGIDAKGPVRDRLRRIMEQPDISAIIARTVQDGLYRIRSSAANYGEVHDQSAQR